MKATLRRVMGEVAKAIEVHQRIAEHRNLRGRPWLEESLHWSRDGQLHGHIAPPPRSRQRSVASDGWCPGLAPQLRSFDS